MIQTSDLTAREQMQLKNAVTVWESEITRKNRERAMLVMREQEMLQEYPKLKQEISSLKDTVASVFDENRELKICLARIKNQKSIWRKLFGR